MGSEAEVYYTLSEDEYADRVYFFLDEPISKAYISSLEQNYYLISNNAVAIKEETGKTVEQLAQEVGNARKNFLSALGKMKILRLVYLILRMIILLQCIRWSGQRRKRKRAKFCRIDRAPKRYDDKEHPNNHKDIHLVKNGIVVSYQGEKVFYVTNNKSYTITITNVDDKPAHFEAQVVDR